MTSIRVRPPSDDGLWTIEWYSAMGDGVSGGNLRNLLAQATQWCECGHHMSSEHDQHGCLYTTSKGGGCGCEKKADDSPPA